MANTKEQRALLRRASKDGYATEHRRNGHQRISAACGCFMTISNSPRSSAAHFAAQRDYERFHRRHRGGRCER